jgi:hypothetical protein
MSGELKSPVLDDWLGRVRSHLPLRRGGDILRELESSIRDRVDDLAAAESRDPDDDLVRRALSEMGEPERVADAYARDRAIVIAANYRSLLFYTAMTFAVHVALVGVATTLGRALVLGPITLEPLDTDGVFGVAAAALHALLLDIGAMALLFAGLGAIRRRAHAAPRPLRVEASPRSAIGRMVLAVLVAVVLVVFRDEVFVVVSGRVRYPLFTEWFTEVLPLVTAVLALSVVSDALYLFLGERRLTLAVDALHGAAGLACMLFIIRDPVLALPPIDALAQFHEPVNDFLERLSTLVVGFLALVFALKTVRRAMRFSQL